MIETGIPSVWTQSLWYLSIAVSLLGSIVAGVLYFLRQRGRPKSVHVDQENILIAALMDVEEAAVLANKHGFIILINPAAEKLLRQRARSTRGKYHTEVFHLLDPVKHTPIPWMERNHIIREQLFRDCLFNCRGLQDVEITYLVKPFSLSGDDADHVLLLLKDQSELKALQAHLNYVQMNDPQTKLLNRKSFEIKLKVALDEARQQGVKHSFCHVALDQFKLVNDTLGHSAGDAFIERISELLKNAIDKRRDVLARIGGDEFGILFREAEPIEALRKAESLRNAVMRYNFVWDGQPHKITASVGFVPIHKQSGTPNRVFSLADAACRVAKAKGGNRLHLYRPDDVEINKHRGQLLWIGRLRKAFESGEFRLYAQPIQPLEPRAFLKPFHHYEILLRLFDAEGKAISPDEFIPVAEYYSMMPKLDRWVFKELLTHIQRITKCDPLPIFAVNLSGQSLDDPTFLKYVLDVIKWAGVPPTMLCFEITERVAISNIALAHKFIDTLKMLGCSFSLDDFGTGVSSFAYLKQLPVNYLKIDGSFVKDIATDDVGRAMVQSVHQVGQLMSVKTIAEYVENEQIIRILRDIGIEFGQGYGISRPIPLPDIIATHLQPVLPTSADKT